MVDIKPAFGPDDYEILERQIGYKGFFRLVRYQLRHQLFAGGWSNSVMREVVERQPSAAVLLYDPILDSVILVEQFRIGALHDKNGPWLIELVAGVCVPDEPPDQLVIREAQEEADCKILDLHHIASYWASPGGTEEYLNLYCGRVDASNAGGIHGLPEEGEDIKVHVAKVADAFHMLKTGTINNAHTIIALQWLQLNHEFIRKRWS